MAIVDSARTPWWSWTWPALGMLILGLHFLAGAGIVLQAVEASLWWRPFLRLSFTRRLSRFGWVSPWAPWCLPWL